MAGERGNEEAKKKKEWNDGDATLHSMPASRILPPIRAHPVAKGVTEGIYYLPFRNATIVAKLA